MFTCTATSFAGKIDSRGRITIPAGIREGLGLDEGDQVILQVADSDRITKKVESRSQALDFLSKIERTVESFSYDGEILEVVLSE